MTLAIWNVFELQQKHKNLKLKSWLFLIEHKCAHLVFASRVFCLCIPKHCASQNPQIVLAIRRDYRRREGGGWCVMCFAVSHYRLVGFNFAKIGLDALHARTNCLPSKMLCHGSWPYLGIICLAMAETEMIVLVEVGSFLTLDGMFVSTILCSHGKFS